MKKRLRVELGKDGWNYGERDVERGDRLEWCVNFMGKSVWMNRYTTGTHSIGVYEWMKKWNEYF